MPPHRTKHIYHASSTGKISASMLKLSFLIFLAVTAAGGEVRFGGSYSFSQNVLMFDHGMVPVGFKLTGQLNLANLNNGALLAELKDLQLLVKSSQESQDGYTSHVSKIDQLVNKPFVIQLSQNEVKKVYLAIDEDPTLANIKKGLASLFQIRQTNDKFEEKDMSGVCQVDYKNTGNHILKSKTGCHWRGNKLMKSRLWGMKIDSKRFEEIVLTKGNLVDHVVADEEHTLLSAWNKIMRIKTTTQTELKLKDSTILDKKMDLSQVQKDLSVTFNEHNFEFNTNESVQEHPKIKLTSFVKNNKRTITNDIGTSESAQMFLQGVKAASKFTVADLNAYFSSKKYKKKEIVEQVLDIIGSKPTPETHNAVMKFLEIENEDVEVDYCDRYLWALSLNPHPQLFIINDLFELGESRHSNAKLWQTIVLTVPAMVYSYTQKNPDDAENDKLLQRGIDFLINHLNRCEDEDFDCQKVYMRAFVNIPDPKTLSYLLQFKKIFNKRLIVEIMSALQKIDAKHWTKEVLDLAEEVYLANSTYDSTARIISLDMLLKTKINDNATLMKILSVLKHNDVSKELKQYLMISLEGLYEKNEGLKKKVNTFLRDNRRNNYDSQALSGFSTTFHRTFMDGGRLSTVQEISNSILKSGVVNVDILNEGQASTAFSLGLYSKGLSSFVSSAEDESDDALTAGMQLRVMNVSLRPFVFFDGNGELMSHVFAGTASTLTPAYQALVLLDDDTVALPLGIGHIAQISFMSGASVDLSGQNKLSLWYKTGNTLVQNKAGLAFEGKISLNLPFVKTEVEFNLFATPELHLLSSLNFGDGIAMCLELDQPDLTVRYTTYKVEQVMGSKHKVKKTSNTTIQAPGRSFALNSMNNAMCNALAKQGWFDEENS
ncbi:microsomal triglyceride transfer protein large subunit [Cimex lectularius]|uniref:Vitellogenin domain-containing protein n=1 Tax=Cimex lectularius TaxID=79782 RepID=A0A8I6RY25_CIMLE|nr:microsomal triglyceride transfer protein large subunit [Cimex lectularius]